MFKKKLFSNGRTDKRTDRQTDGRTVRLYYAPNFIWGHKNKTFFLPTYPNFLRESVKLETHTTFFCLTWKVNIIHLILNQTKLTLLSCDVVDAHVLHSTEKSDSSY